MATSSSPVPSPRIVLPSATGALLLPSPILFMFGLISLVASAGEMRGPLNLQAAIGFGLMAAAVGCAIGALVLLGVRQIAQQQVDLLREADGRASRADG
ncbi:hypothetical protein [Brachybacterium hainanense]|uniref:Uncharacterized protein n=1 Tax=Brachybacterium hainanense TaxID=1541174 RepID=A0ABV6RAS2_9MICO